MSVHIEQTPDGQPHPSIAEHAAEIRKLGKRVIRDVIEIGRRLTECRDVVGHGHWHDWLNAEFGWSEQTALNYMRVYEMAKSKKFLDLDIPITALHLVAAPNTPEEARDEIIERARAGENLPVADVKKTIARAKINDKSNRLPRTLNPKPLRDIVDGCIAAVRRRIEGTVLELNRYTPPKRRAQLERLFAGLADTIPDLEHKALPAEAEAAAEAENQATAKGSEPAAQLLKPEPSS